MTDREEDSFSQVIHNGYGPQIVGPNYGDIKYEIDPNMRALLTGVSEDAAKLVGIVKQALSDGFMSEYSVTTFNRTAQHISDDLVDRLGWATRNLSEDNIDQLGWATRNLPNMSEDNVDRLGWATRNITEETVNRLSSAAENISERTADRFVNVNNELNVTARRIEKALRSASVTQQNGQQPSVVPPIPITAKGAEQARNQVQTDPLRRRNDALDWNCSGEASSRRMGRVRWGARPSDPSAHLDEQELCDWLTLAWHASADWRHGPRSSGAPSTLTCYGCGGCRVRGCGRGWRVPGR